MPITLEYNIGIDEKIVYDNFIHSLPPGNESLQEGIVVPSHTENKPTSFLLKGLVPDSPYLVTIFSETHKPPLPFLGFVTSSPTYSISIPLPHGVSMLLVQGVNNDVGRFFVTVTHYAAIFKTEAKEIAENILRPLNKITDNIESSFGYVIALPLISEYSKFIPTGLEIMALLGNKLIIKNLLHRPGTEAGTIELLSAFCASTPVIHPMQNYGKPEMPLYTGAEDFAGFESHVWLPNREVERWRAFTILINNLPQIYSLEQVTEGQIYVKTAGGNKKHLFDFSSDFANSVLDFKANDECFENLFRLDVVISAETAIQFCQAAYTLDQTIPSPGLATPDVDLLGVSNWTTISLSGRFEQQWDINDEHFWVYDSPVIGAIDGSNKFFALSVKPRTKRAVKLFLDGLLQRLNLDYRLSSSNEFRSGLVEFSSGSIFLGSSRNLIEVPVGEARPFLAPFFANLEVVGGANMQYFITATEQNINTMKFVISHPPDVFGSPQESTLHYITPARLAGDYEGGTQYGVVDLAQGITSFELYYPRSTPNMSYQLFLQYSEDPMPGNGADGVNQLIMLVRTKALNKAVIDFSHVIESPNAKLNWWVIEENNVSSDRGSLNLVSGITALSISFASTYLDPMVILTQIWNPINTTNEPMILTSLGGITTITFTVNFSHPIPSNDYKLDYAVFPAQSGDLVELFYPPQLGQVLEAHYDALGSDWANTDPNELIDGIRTDFTLPFPCPIPESLFLALNGRLLTQGEDNQYVLETPTKLRFNFTPQVGQKLWAVYPIANVETLIPPSSKWSQGFLTRQGDDQGAFASGKIHNLSKIEPGDFVVVSDVAFTAINPASALISNPFKILSGDSLVFEQFKLDASATPQDITLTSLLFTSPIQFDHQFQVGKSQELDALSLVSVFNNHALLSQLYFAEYLGAGKTSIKAKFLGDTFYNLTIRVIGSSMLASNVTGDAPYFKNEVQSLTLSSVPTSGKYNFIFSGEISSDINYDDSPGIITAKLNDMTYLSGVEVTQNSATELIVSFLGLDNGKDQALLDVYDYEIDFQPSVVNVTDNSIYLPNHGLKERQSVAFFTTAVLPTPFVIGDLYYVHIVDNDNIKVMTTPDSVSIDITDSGTGTHILAVNTLLDASSYRVSLSFTELVKGFSNRFPAGVSRELDSAALSLALYNNDVVRKNYYVTNYEAGSIDLTAKRLGTKENGNIVISGNTMFADSISGGGNLDFDKPFQTYKSYYTHAAPAVTLDGVYTRSYKNYNGKDIKFNSRPVVEQEPYYIAQTFNVDHHPLDTFTLGDCNYPKGLFTQGLITSLLDVSLSVPTTATFAVSLDNLPFQEAPQGVQDGVNTVFTLTFISCAGTNSLMLWLDGIFQPPTSYSYISQFGIGYITLSSPPSSDQTLWAWYLPLGDACVDERVVGMPVDGISQTFSIPSSPFLNRTSLVLFLEGLFQLQDVDYIIPTGNTTLTYLGTKTPEVGQSLWGHFNRGTIGSENWRQISIGVGNGVDTDYIIPNLLLNELPASKESVILSLDGLVQRLGVDYNVIAVDGFPTGDIIFVDPPEENRQIHVAYIRRG